MLPFSKCSPHFFGQRVAALIDQRGGEPIQSAQLTQLTRSGLLCLVLTNSRNNGCKQGVLACLRWLLSVSTGELRICDPGGSLPIRKYQLRTPAAKCCKS